MTPPGPGKKKERAKLIIKQLEQLKRGREQAEGGGDDSFNRRAFDSSGDDIAHTTKARKHLIKF